MAKIPNFVEILPKITTAWVGCMSVTDDRQTDDRETTAYSEREHEFMFAKNCREKRYATVNSQHHLLSQWCYTSQIPLSELPSSRWTSVSQTMWYTQVWDQWLKEGRWAPCLVYTPLKNMVTFTCYLYWGDSCNEKKLNTCFSASISMNCWTLVSTGITARSLDACISASIAASLPASMCLTPAPRPFPPRLHNNKNQ